MSWISRLFGGKEAVTNTAAAIEDKATPAAANTANPLSGLEGIRFGRYSDNNKTLQKIQSWHNAEDLFKEKKYNEAFFSFFDNLRDEAEDNVHFRQEGNTFTFDILQGSKKIHGKSDGQNIVACVPLAMMETPGTAIMRRMLDLNYILNYCRTAVDDHSTLCMLFDTSIATANPNKMYYALRELAVKADDQDDLLLADFNTLKSAGTDHIRPLGAHELEVKYKYFQKWIADTLSMADALNQDAFSGAIAYLLLTLIYRIDFLITPEAKLLIELGRISSLYWEKKEELPLVERNQMMKDAIRKLQDITPEDFAKSMYHSCKTFSVNMPPADEKVKEHINGGIKDSQWYVENKYPGIALMLTEYGVLYNHFIYSMPQVTTELTIIFMAVLHADYFAELGMQEWLYNPADGQFNQEAISYAVNEAVVKYQTKYPDLYWDPSHIFYDNLYYFGASFSGQMANLNLETKRE